MGQTYEFTGETMTHEGHILHRIRSTLSGKLGGWIEKEENLDHNGGCWVCDEAKVYGNAKVNFSAWICGNAEVYGNAWVGEDASVYGNAKIYGNAFVHGDALVEDNAQVSGGADVYDNAHVYGNAKVYDNAEVCYCAHVYGNAKVFGSAKVYGVAHVYGDAKVYGNAKVDGNAQIHDKYINCGEYGSSDYKEDSLNNNTTTEVIQDFIYKIDDSNKITIQTEYDSVDEFFNTSITNDIKLDTLVICTVDAKEPLIKLQKVEAENKTEFKFIVDITNENGDDFIFRSIIKSQEQLNQLIQQTIEALKQYPKFNKYIDDLENCL